MGPTGSGALPTFAFGSFALDPARRELRNAAGAVKLAPQPFTILLMLVSRAGELVTREEVKQQVWGENTFVDFEQGLNFCIRRIRAVLQDDAEHPVFIETVPRRGYRFVAPVERIDPAPAASGVELAAPTSEEDHPARPRLR